MINKLKPGRMQSTIMAAFSIVSISIMLILGVVMYIRFSVSSRQDIIQSTQKLMEQTGENLEDYLVSMRQISDAVYYNVIKENDLYYDETLMGAEDYELYIRANKVTKITNILNDGLFYHRRTEENASLVF